MPSGPRQCQDDTHPHTLMCPVQAALVVTRCVAAGFTKGEAGTALAWWEVGLRHYRYADALEAITYLVGAELGDRYKVTARDLVKRIRATRADRIARAPEPVAPEGVDSTRWLYLYRRSVGNGDAPGVALELASQAVGLDRYIEAAPVVDGDEGPVDDETKAVILAKIRRPNV